MKKVFTLFLGATVLLTACNNGSEEKAQEKATATKTATKEVSKEDQSTVKIDGVTLKEPTKDTKCAACDMKVYQKSDALGKFSATAVDEVGKQYFFDDLYCLLNYERKSKIKLKEKFVRDYKTLEWINVKDAKFVNGKIKTPMNVGYASFKNQEDAQKFAHEHHSKVDDLSVADKKALERFMKKKQEMQQDVHNNDDNHSMHQNKDEHQHH